MNTFSIIEKQRAARIVRDALRKGILTRPDSCSKCGSTDTKCIDGRAKIQAHHPDYSSPLLVEWICCQCHRKETPMPEVYTLPHRTGEENNFSKLSTDDVIAARKLRRNGMKFIDIAKIMNVHKTTIIRAVYGETWGHLSAAPTKQKEGE